MVKYQFTVVGAQLCTSLDVEEMSGDNMNIRRAPEWDSHDLCEDGELAFTIDFETEAFDHKPRDVFDVVFLKPEHYVIVNPTQQPEESI